MARQQVQKNKGKRSWKNLSCQTITTSDLFRIQPIFCREVLPHDKMKVSMRQLSRLDSLPFPSFVNIHNRNIWYYCKMTDLWSPWNSFINDGYWYYNGQNYKVNKTLHMTKEWFTRYWFSRMGFNVASDTFTLFGDGSIDNSLTSSPLLNHDYDLYFQYPTNTYGCNLNNPGRIVFSILYSLGFRLPYATLFNDFSTNKFTDSYVNLMPLLAYANIFVYNFIPAKFRDSYIQKLTGFRYRLSSFTGTPTVADSKLFDDLFSIFTYNFYGSDYFTDSLESLAPKGYQSGSEYDLNVGLTTAEVKSENAGDTYHRQPGIKENSVSGAITYLSQYMLTLLKNKTIASQIANITPGSTQARLIGLLGIKSDAGSHQPIEIARNYDSIVIRPEVAQADTAQQNGKPLGYKAGSAEQYYQDKKDHDFSFDDYGILICVNAVVPDYFYYAGTHREMMHVDREDFAQELYADTGMQAVALEELYNYDSLNPVMNFNLNSYFGFQTKYAEYGYRKDILGGAFCIPTQNLALDAFHFGRQFVDSTPVDETTEVPHQNDIAFAVCNWAGMQSGSAYNKFHQFDRIFNYQSSMADHIQQWTYFDISMKRDVAANGDFTIGDNGGRTFEIPSISDVKSY